MLEASSNFQG
jgi:hypothetical protein